MLIAATLFARSLHNLKNVDLGFRQDRLFEFSLNPSLNGYKTDRTLALAETVQQRIAHIAGVRASAIGVNLVVSGNENLSTITVVGYQAKEDEDMNPYVDTVSPAYFSTMGIPLLRGREFTAGDRAGAPMVAIVNDAFANYYFKGENPLGRRFAFRRDGDKTREIVGVVRGSKYEGVTEAKTPREVYLPFQQDDSGQFVVYARATADPKTLFGAVQREIAGLDAALPVTGLRTMEEQVNENLSAQRHDGVALGIFRRARHPAGGSGALWRDGLHGDAAYARDRHPAGAGRGPREPAGAGDARSRDPDGGRCGGGGAAGCGAVAICQGAAIRRGAD